MISIPGPEERKKGKRVEKKGRKEGGDWK